jgi:hypothetical protein
VLIAPLAGLAAAAARVYKAIKNSETPQEDPR